MMLNCQEYKVKKYLNLLPLGDVHFGARDCNEEVFQAHLDKIKRTPDCAIILMGDMINCGTRVSVGAGTYDDDYHPQEQYDRMMELLRPIKDKLIGGHIGNHEERIRELSSFNITKSMCRELEIPYLGYSALHKIKVNDVNFHINSTHGSTGSGSLMGKMRNCMKLQDNADADIYLYGHTHGLDYNPQPYYRINNRGRYVEEQMRHFVLTGGFVNWDGSYGEKKNYSMLPIGMPKIRLYGELSRGKKKVEVRFSDK